MGIGTFEEHQELQIVSKSAEEGRLKEALAHSLNLLEKDPLHRGALVLASYAFRRLGANVQAYHFALAGVREFPEEISLWANLGGAAQGLWLQDEAETAYRKALSLAKEQKHLEVLYLNLGALAIDCGDFVEGEKWTRKLLELRPNDRNVKGNLGFCLLARRDWEEGWKYYNNCVGSDFLPKVQYKDEPEWDGTPGKTVVVYEDQGVGDAINFASALPDAIAASKKVILDCEPRLCGLFKRSFPAARIYPTRREKGTSGFLWAKDDRDFDASIPLSQISQFYRNTAESFPGTPYLRPCEVRRGMWRSYLQSLARPTIGVAWTGGIMRTNARFRSITLEELVPLFKSVPNAHWVSLQYKSAEKEIQEFKAKHPDIDLVQYPFATLTADYDDTAALVAALDYVVCMQTAVAHLAGALGTPVSVLIPTHTTWRYAVGDDSPWYKSMQVVRQTGNDWRSAVDRVSTTLNAHFGELPEAAGRAAREVRTLRGNGSALRPYGSGDHKAPIC